MTSDPVAPQWLNPTEMRVWRAWLEATGRVGTQVNAGLKEAGMLHDDYEVLVHLSEAADRRLRMSDLSERLLQSNSRLTQRVDRLERRGWVCRVKCPEDRRGTFAELTDDGFDALVSTAPAHVSDVRAALIDQLEPGELEIMATALERIAGRLRS